MTTRRRTPARTTADPTQLRLFAEVESALARSASDIRAEHAAQPELHAAPRPALLEEPAAATPTAPAPAPRATRDTEAAGDVAAAVCPTVSELALAHLAAHADHDRALFAFRRDPASVELVKHAVDAERAAKACYERALHEVQSDDQNPDRAKAAYSRAVLAIATSAYEASREHLLAVSEAHRAHVYGGSVLTDYEARVSAEQDILDRRAGRVEHARQELLAAVAAKPAAYLPRLAVDASPQRVAHWQTQVAGIETYRARFGVTHPVHPLGPRPVDLDGALEYERTTRQLRIEGRGPVLTPELAHAVEQRQ